MADHRGVIRHSLPDHEPPPTGRKDENGRCLCCDLNHTLKLNLRIYGNVVQRFLDTELNSYCANLRDERQDFYIDFYAKDYGYINCSAMENLCAQDNGQSSAPTWHFFYPQVESAFKLCWQVYCKRKNIDCSKRSSRLCNRSEHR